MRVHERGVGETRSCGTGTVAVAAAYLAVDGPVAPDRSTSGARRSVVVSIADDDSTLTGPAVRGGVRW